MNNENENNQHETPRGDLSIRITKGAFRSAAFSGALYEALTEGAVVSRQKGWLYVNGTEPVLTAFINSCGMVLKGTPFRPPHFPDNSDEG